MLDRLLLLGSELPFESDVAPGTFDAFILNDIADLELVEHCEKRPLTTAGQRDEVVALFPEVHDSRRVVDRAMQRLQLEEFRVGESGKAFDAEGRVCA